MSDSIFKSNLAGKINGFVSFKRNQGYKYDGQPLYILRKFDDFCLTHGNPYAFSKEIVTGFILDFKENYNFKRCDFIGPIRQMGIYLNAIGDSQAYIPAKDFQVKDHAKDIYIMTDEEVAAFFHQLDLYFYENRNDGRVCHYGRELLYPAYFRLLHTTGCRTFEARWLKVSDVNLDLKYIDIMNSKGNRDRRLYIRGDLADYLKQYYERIKELFPDTEYFFPSINGTVSKYGSGYSDFFRKIWKRTSFYIENAKQPTPYSLRHYFATANIIRWAANGEDVYACLPYLMRAMGHGDIESTYYYVHLVQQHYGMIKEKCAELEGLFPEVTKYDEDFW